MIKICDLYQDFKGDVNTWQGGHAKPNVFASWLHSIQIEILNDLVKSWGNNQVVTDNARPLLKRAQLPVKDFAKGGLIDYPKDYRYFSSLMFYSKTKTGAGCLCADIPLMDKDGQCNELTEEDKAELLNANDLCERSIEMIPNNFWGAVCSDEIVPPSLEVPYATQYDKGVKIMPEKIGYVVLYYVAIPPRPIFKYTTDNKQNIICGECVDLVWGEEMIPEFLSRLKKKYASFTSNTEKYVQGVKETDDVKS